MRYLGVFTEAKRAGCSARLTAEHTSQKQGAFKKILSNCRAQVG